MNKSVQDSIGDRQALRELNIWGLLERARALPDFPPNLKMDLYNAYSAIVEEISRREAGGDPDDYGGYSSEVLKAGDPIAGVVCRIKGHAWDDYDPGAARKWCSRCKRQESITALERRWARSIRSTMTKRGGD